MRMKKRVTISLVLLTLVMVLAGCGGISKKEEQAARELINKMIAAADGAVVSKSDCTTELNFQLIFGGKEHGYGIDYQTHNEYDKESGRVASIVNYADDEEPGSTRFYMAEELGVFYIYGYHEQVGWIKYDSGFVKEEMSRNFVSNMNLENAEIVEFIENYKKVNEKNVHRLRVKLKDANIRELVFESGVKEVFWGKEYNSIDLSDADVQVDYYVDANTSQVVEVEVKLDGMNNFMQELVAYRNNLQVEEEFESVKSSVCTLKYENISYDDVKVPMLSVEEKKNSFWVLQEDTTYNLKVMEAEVDVVCPKGWMVIEKSTDILRIASINDEVEINFYLYFPATIKEMEDGISSDIEYFKDEGSYVADKKGPNIDGFETYELVIKDGVFTYVYTPLKRAVFEIFIEEYTGDHSEEIVKEILDMVNCKEMDW